MIRFDFSKSFRLHCEKWIGGAMTCGRDTSQEAAALIQERVHGVLTVGVGRKSSMLKVLRK